MQSRMTSACVICQRPGLTMATTPNRILDLYLILLMSGFHCSWVALSWLQLIMQVYEVDTAFQLLDSVLWPQLRACSSLYSGGKFLLPR